MAHPQPLLLLLTFLAALLYSSVGHGGASGYLAALSLFGFAPAGMRASALLLNLLVSAISFLSYRAAGHFRSRLFWPFAAASIPLSFVGGWVNLPPRLYATLLAAALCLAAGRLAWNFPATGSEPVRRPSLPTALAAGGGIGLLSGMVGVGGGIFLSPLMILLRWADAQETAAVSAAFIWVNSAAGLYGNLSRQGTQDLTLWPLALVAGAGGVIGARTGARRLSPLALRRLMSLVLLIAAYKLVRLALWPA